jgi:mercuric ion transport protein
MALHKPIAAPSVADVPTPSAQASEHVFAVAGVVAGLGAIAASSCCIVPLTLASLGAGAGIFGSLEALTPWRIPLLGASVIAVAVGWFAWWRKRRVACDPGSMCAAQARSPASLLLLFLASLIVVTAIGWNHVEPYLLKLVQSA